MKESLIINNKNSIIKYVLIVYYLILTVILYSWTNIEQSPSIVKRVIFITLFIFPLLKYRFLFPALLLSFSFMQSNMIANVGYFPNKPLFILILCLIIYLFVKKEEKQIFRNKNKVIRLFLYFIIYTCFVSFTNLVNNYNGVITLIFVYLVSFFFSQNLSLKYFLIIFPIACIFNSIYFFTNMSLGIIETSSGSERAFFNDPNMTALNIGFGIIISFMFLMQNFSSYFRNKNIFLYIIHAINILLSLVCVTIIASRGAFIAIALTLMIIFNQSKIKRNRKFLILLFGIVLLYILYDNGLFSTIIDRLNEEDVSSGNGRLDIWKVGFNRFFQLNILYIIFGGGDYFALEVCKKAIAGYTGLLSPHNQFIWYIFDYGILGGLMFIIILFKLLYFSIKSNNRIYLLIIYSIIGFMTLPPISSSIIYPCFMGFIFGSYNKNLLR